MAIGRALLAGLAGGAAGTTALNAVTYLDMAVRGRGTSSTPQDTVEAIATKAGWSIPGDQQTRENRDAGLGALIGILAGVGVGAALGVAQAAGWRPLLIIGGAAAGAGAMLATDAPMAMLGVSDPRTWSVKDWISDAVPHLAYGFVAAAVVRSIAPSEG